MFVDHASWSLKKTIIIIFITFFSVDFCILFWSLTNFFVVSIYQRSASSKRNKKVIFFLVMLKQIQKKSHNQQQQLYYYQNFKDITKCDIGAFKYYLM